MRRFLETVTPARAREILAAFAPVGTEEVGGEATLGRVCAREVRAREEMPAFDRAVMDGYALKAEDTFGASESQPAYLELAGRVAMGEVWGEALRRGTCVEISTGGAMPAGADAVVMVEHTREVERTVEVQRAAAPWEHVIRRGDDLKAGAPVVAAGARMGPPAVAGLAAFGVTRVAVFRRPRVAILSTGNELVAAWSAGCPPGKVRDVNAPALAAQVAQCGGEPVLLGLAPDEREALRGAIARALDEGADLVLVSGGSSQGARDLTAEVLEGFGPPGVLAHGIAVAPGKPTILAARGRVPLIGMPGHPVSSMVIFRLFVDGLVRRLGGESPLPDPFPARRRARLSRNVPSKPGREDYVRVRFTQGDVGAAVAEPLLGGTAALSTVLRADGLVCIPLEREGLRAGDEVEVLFF